MGDETRLLGSSDAVGVDAGNSGMGELKTGSIAFDVADFRIVGTDCQVVEITLTPGQQCTAEPGAMTYCSNGVKPYTSAGFSSVSRALSGESLFKVKWTNSASDNGFVAFTAPIPSNIVPVDLANYPAGIVCKRDAFLAAVDPNTKATIAIQRARTCLACCFSGLDLVMQKVDGPTWAFLNAHGTILQKVLGPGERIVVDTQSVVALDPTVTVDVRCAGEGCNCCFLGEGAFNTVLEGPGLVVLSSLPISKLRKLFRRPPGKRDQAKQGISSDNAEG